MNNVPAAAARIKNWVSDIFVQKVAAFFQHCATHATRKECAAARVLPETSDAWQRRVCKSRAPPPRPKEYPFWRKLGSADRHQGLYQHRK
jgi:hypothetical protein